MKITEAEIRQLIQLKKAKGETLDLHGRDLTALGLSEIDLAGQISGARLYVNLI